MKYLLKQNKEDKGILCNKVTIDGFDYYVNTNHKSSKGYYLTENRFLVLILKEHAHSEMFSYEGQIVSTGVYVNFINIDKFSKVIATTNTNTNIPKVVDEIEKLAIEYEKNKFDGDLGMYPINIYKDGYNKSQEIHPYSEEFFDWIDKEEIPREDGKWIKYFNGKDNYLTTKELLQLWKEQQPKVIYYE